MSPENSLRGRFSEGKVKGISDAREAPSTCEGGGNHSSLLPRARIPFPFPFERLLLRLSRKENPKQTQPTYSVHTGTRTRWQASAPPTVPRWLLPFSKLTNRKFRSCSFLRVSLSLAISSTFLWRNPNKNICIFVLAATRLKLFKTTRNKSFCLFADLFFLFRVRTEMETAEGLLTASPRGWGWRMEKKDLKFVSFFFSRSPNSSKKNEITSVNRPQIFFSGKNSGLKNWNTTQTH